METKKGRIEVIESVRFLNGNFELINREEIVSLFAGIFDAAFASLYQQAKIKWSSMEINVKRPFICFIEDINDPGEGLNEVINYSLFRIKQLGHNVSEGNIIINAAHIYYTQGPSDRVLDILDKGKALRPHLILNKAQFVKIVPREFFAKENKLALCLTIIGFLCLELWKVAIPFYSDSIKPEEASSFAGFIMEEVSVLMGKIPLEFKEQVQNSYGVFASLIQKFTQEKNPDGRMGFILCGLCVACFALFLWANDNISMWEENIFLEESYNAVFAKLITL